MPINKTDFLAVNDERLDKVVFLIDRILSLTGYRLASHTGVEITQEDLLKEYRGWGTPIRSLCVSFLTQKPTDKRRKFLGITFQGAPRGDLVGRVYFNFSDSRTEITSIEIKAYGTQQRTGLLNDIAELLAEKYPELMIDWRLDSREPFKENFLSECDKFDHRF